MNRRLLITVFTVLALVVAVPAMAGKGGNGNGKGNGGSREAAESPAWVKASLATGTDRIYLEGCGYEFAPVYVKVEYSAGQTVQFWVGMWNTGCMDTAYFLSLGAGTYTVEVYQENSPQLALKATTTLDVVD